MSFVADPSWLLGCKNLSYLSDMSRPRDTSAVCSKVAIKRRRRSTDRVVEVGSAPTENDDPFATFAEWSGEADEKAYRKL